MSIDKRDIKRHKKRIQLRYGLENPDKIAFTEDISSTGIFIKSPIVLQPGKIIFIELVVNSNTPIRLKGRIMWAKKVPQNLLRKVKGGMGIHILSFEQGEDEYCKLCESLAR